MVLRRVILQDVKYLSGEEKRWSERIFDSSYPIATGFHLQCRLTIFLLFQNDD